MQLQLNACQIHIVTYCFLKYVVYVRVSVCVCVLLCVGSQHKREPRNQLQSAARADLPLRG